MQRLLAAVPPSMLVTVIFVGILTFWIVESRGFAVQDRYLPMFAGIMGLVFALGQLVLDTRRFIHRYRSPELLETHSQVLDIAADTGLPNRVVLARAGQYTAWIVGLLLGIWTVGFSTALLLFVFGYLRFVAHARWLISIGITLVIAVITYVFFDGLLGILWPTSVIESLTGVSTDIIPVIRRSLFDLGLR